MAALKKFHFRGPYLCQNCSLPDSIIYSITMMPSNAKAWEKLIQSCKYFFSKNSICVVNDLHLHYWNNLELSTDFDKWVSIKNLTVKLWITNKIGSSCSSLSLIFLKLYKTDYKKLDLYHQTISYIDFLFISSNVENIESMYAFVTNEDFTIVPLEKLVKVLPKIKYINFHVNHIFPIITLYTVKELLVIPHFLKISKINLHEIPETFDIETFFAFIKKNKQIKFSIDFHYPVSAAYKIRVEAIIDEIRQTENHDYKEFGLIQPKNTKVPNNMLSPSCEKLILSPQSNPMESDDDDLPAPPPSIAAKSLNQTSSTSNFSSSTPTIPSAASESTIKSMAPLPIHPKPKHTTYSSSISSLPPPPPLPPSFTKSLYAPPSSSSSSNVTPKRTSQNIQRILSPDLQDEIRSPPKLKSSDEAEKEREKRKSKTQIIKRNETADFKTIISHRADKVNANTSDDEKENDSEWDD